MDTINSLENIQTLVKQGFTDWKRYGNVVVRRRGDLLIFNYTSEAQYSERWNFFESVSRGLIIHANTGEIVARPFDKFFNWGQGGRKAQGHLVTVMEKVDGSLGILYRENGQYAVATRGDTQSDQAQWATQFLRANYDLSDLDPALTLLFEIIYPDNRVVVDYGTREDLVLLAARNRFTGEYLPFFPDLYELGTKYGFTLPQVYHFNNVTDILAQTGVIEADQEGWVLEFSDGNRFKIKGDRYLEMHRLISELTFKNTLRALEYNTYRNILDTVPDEFLGQVKAWAEQITNTVDDYLNRIDAAFAQAPQGSRKQFALWVESNYPNLSPYLFAKLDDRDVRGLIFKYAFLKDLTEDNS